MIQIELLGPSAGPARSAEARAPDAGGASFLSVLTQGAARPGTAAGKTGDAAEAPPTDAQVEAALPEPDSTDVSADGEATEAADPVSGEDDDDPVAAHDDLVAAAIAAADPEAEGTAALAVGSAVPAVDTTDPALPADDRALLAAEIRPRQTPSRDAPAATDSAGLPSRTIADVSAAPAAGSGRMPADGAVSSGGGGIEPDTIPGGSTGRDRMAMQIFPSSTSQAAAAPVHAASAMLPGSAQPEGDLPIRDPALLAGRMAAGPRGDAAGPSVQQPTPDEAVPVALFAAEGMRSDRDAPSRRAAYPAGQTGEIAARVTATAVASPSAVQPVPGAPDPAPAGNPAVPSMKWAETAAEGAEPQSGADEMLLGPATSASQQARGYPALVAAVEPQRVTQQIAEEVRRSGGGSIELALSPKELGSVRMSIQATETGTAIVMTAERDETMHLLRRHAEMLHEAFRELGLGTLDLSFGGRGGQAARPDFRASGAAGPGPAEIADIPQQPTPRLASGGLDLRM